MTDTKSDKKIKLFFSPNSRSTRPRWVLEELGIPYEIVRIDIRSQEGRSETFKKAHPKLTACPFFRGSVPALEDGDVVLTESAAIVNYLADVYGKDKKLIPTDQPARAYYDQLMFWLMTELEAPLWNITRDVIFVKAEDRDAKAAGREKTRFFAAAAQIAEQLKAKGGKFVFGDHFTAADILAAHTLGWSNQPFISKPYEELPEETRKVLGPYLAAMAEREAFKKAFAPLPDQTTTTSS